MQKNNFKLKTIFKKGLSFSIALALGAAATSLNMAKIADAATATAGANTRNVYVAGEKFDKSTFTNGGYHRTVKDNTTARVNTDYTVPATPGAHTVYLASEAGPDNDELAFTYTVVPTSVFSSGAATRAINVREGASVADVRAAIFNALPQDAFGANEYMKAISKWNAAEVHINGANFTGTVAAANKGQKVSLVIANGPTIDVGVLNIALNATNISLVSAPSNLGYASGAKLNFDGLKIKVTYTDGSTAEVAYDNTTKSRFSFHKHSDTSSLSPESTMDAANVVVDVVYGGQELENAFTFYYCSGNTELKNGQVTVSGSFATGNTLVVNNIPEAEYNTLYEQFQKELGKEPEIIFDKDISLTMPRAYIGSVNVQLNVGEDYAGKFVTVKHLIDANTVETFHCKVLKDGYINFSCNHLSPFMVALGVKDEAAAAEASKKAEEAAKKAEEAAKAKSGSGSAKTGDMSVIAFSVFGFVALISAAVLAYLKKARKSFDK